MRGALIEELAPHLVLWLAQRRLDGRGDGQVGQGVVTSWQGCCRRHNSAATGGSSEKGHLRSCAAGVSLAANEIADSIDIVAHDPGTNPPASR